MKKNKEILDLSEEILSDITNDRLPLHNILLKTSRLSLLLDLSENINLFKGWATFAEKNSFVVGSFQSNIEAAKDPAVSMSSANPSQYLHNPNSNMLERIGIRNQTSGVIENLAKYRAETYTFVMNIYTKWKFGSISESIFEKKRKKAEPILQEIFPDINQRLNSIEQNINSENSEDWKNAVVSCRTLLMEIADILKPYEKLEEKERYINRLKDFVSPKIIGKTKSNLLTSFLEELKNRIEFTLDLTQGGAHKERPIKDEAEDIILYTYLLVADLMSIYASKKEESKK